MVWFGRVRRMHKESDYFIYRNRKLPEWWCDYLPDEKKLYKDEETLTLEKGCLANYWHFHSSNKHPNYKGAEACNLVHKMIRERFGGAFLTSDYGLYAGRRGEDIYREPTHLVYEEAYLGEDGKIYIRNAKKYYEDVIVFIQKILREISRNHMPSGNSYDAREFFPGM